MMLEHLNEVNDMPIVSCFDKAFESYGRIITGYDCSSMIEYMSAHTDIPANGNIYVAGDEGLENLPLAAIIEQELFGGMPIQVGYCNGKNTHYNAMEYHKGSEINIAVTDFCAVLGHVWEIRDNKFFVGDETVFYIPQGTVFEMYQTTLHYSPCTVTETGFKNVVILPKGSNTPLENKPQNPQGEAALLLQKNKWLLAHPDNPNLQAQGAFPGLIGENKEIKF